eukprot:366500-Chlamydomonas_euryale.AAC.2
MTENGVVRHQGWGGCADTQHGRGENRYDRAVAAAPPRRCRQARKARPRGGQSAGSRAGRQRAYAC